MSANNYILIMERSNKAYSVRVVDMDTNKTLEPAIHCKTLRKAIWEANNIQAQEEIEYGLQIQLLK